MGWFRRTVVPAIWMLLCVLVPAANSQKGKGGGCVAPAPINPVVNACFSSTPQSGCIDSTFGNGGEALLSNIGAAPQGAVRLQPQADGTQKIIVFNQTGTSATVARFNLDGSLDSTFGTGGFSIGGTGVHSVYDGTIDANGNILVAGSGVGGLLVMRFLPNGGVDTSFATQGAFMYQLNSSGWGEGRGLAIQPDGKIVAVGQESVGSRGAASLVVRLNPNGTFDTTFGSGGVSSFIPSGAKNGPLLMTVAIQTMGTTNYILTGGGGWFGRLTPSGVIDSSFGSAGQAVGPACGGINARAIYVDGSDNIFLLGYSNAGVTNGPWEINLAKYTASGVLDTSFGNVSGSGHTGYTFLNPFGGVNVPGFSSSLLATTDATGTTKLLVTGQTGSGGSHSVTARYNLDGTLDPTFGGGVVARGFGSGSAWGMGSVVEPNGEIVPFIVVDNGYVALTRYWP